VIGKIEGSLALTGAEDLIAGWLSIAAIIVAYLAWNGNRLVIIGERLARLEAKIELLSVYQADQVREVEMCDKCEYFRVRKE